MIWEYPPSRSTSNNIRTPPCGGIPRGNGVITTFNAGDEVDLKWSIDIDHSNYPLRITLSQNNNDVYDCVILNNIPHPDSTGEPVKMQWKWTVPDVDCPNCALRIEWFNDQDINNDNLCIKDTQNKPYYYSCADIVIKPKNKRSPDRSEFTCYQPQNWPQRNDNCNFFRSGTCAHCYSLSNGYFILDDTKDDGITACPYSTPAYNIGVDTTCNAVDESLILSKQTDPLSGGIPFVYGGKMLAEGIIAVIILLLLIIGIIIVYIIKKKRINNDDPNDSKLNNQNYNQAIIRADDDDGTNIVTA